MKKHFLIVSLSAAILATFAIPAQACSHQPTCYKRCNEAYPNQDAGSVALRFLCLMGDTRDPTPHHEKIAPGASL